jgi:hypothetical protein
MTFRDELERLINCHSMENGSNTPDFILADYLCACLSVFDAHVKARDEWHGDNPALKRMGDCLEPTPVQSEGEDKP